MGKSSSFNKYCSSKEIGCETDNSLKILLSKITEHVPHSHENPHSNSNGISLSLRIFAKTEPFLPIISFSISSIITLNFI